MYVIYVCDTETTGKDPIKNDIIELSMARAIVHLNGKVDVEQKTWYFKPFNPQNIEDEALAVNGYKKEDLLHKTEYGKNTFKDIRDVLPEIELWIDEDNSSIHDRVFIGHNPDFDVDFMLNMWIKAESESTFPFDLKNGNRVLDTKDLILFVDLCTAKRRLYYNLTSCVKSFGVKKEKAHKAEFDVKMTLELFLKIFLPVREFISSKFESSYEN